MPRNKGSHDPLFFTSLSSLAIWLSVSSVLLLAGVLIKFDNGLHQFDQNRIEQFLILASGACIVAFAPHKYRLGLLAYPGISLVILGVFFILGLLAVAISLHARFALLEWATFFLIYVATLLFAAAYLDYRAQVERCWMALLAVVGLIVVIKVMAGYVASWTHNVRLDTQMLYEGVFPNRRFFGQLATLLIPLMGWACLTQKRFAAGWFLLLAAWWMLLFVSGTRGSWMAMVIAHGVVLAWSGRKAFAWGGIQLTSAFAGLGAYWLLFYAVPYWLGIEVGVENRLDNLSTLSGREVIWGLAWQYILANPWLGIGPMHFAAYVNSVAAHPHNAIMQLAAEWGVPAMFAAAFVATSAWFTFVKPLRNKVTPLRLALAVALLGAGIQSMVDGVIVIPYTQTWLALIVGWALGVHWGEHPTLQALPSRFIFSGLRIGGILALGLLIWGVWPEILNRPAATAAYLEHHESLAPRYWAQGWIGKTQ